MADERCIKNRTARPETGFVRSRISILVALCAAVLGPGAAVAAATTAPGPTVAEFDDGLTAGVALWGITAGPDGNLWFSEESNNAVGRITPSAVITEFSAGFPTGSPRGIVTGPDGNLWVAMAGGDGAIAQVTKSGDVTEFPVPTPGDPTDIAVGPDKNLWYVDSAAHLIGRITPEGSITEFSTGLTALSEPSGITKGPDGALWFTETAAGRIGRVTTAGDITEFSSGLSGSSAPKDIVAGPDGNLWFTENAGQGAIGRITPTGDITEFSYGLSLNAGPLGIAVGPDGNLWFTESAAPAIGRITTVGDITEYYTGLVSIVNPWSIAAGPDGNMWFTGNTPGLVGRITLPPLVRSLDAEEITTTSALLRGKVRPNSQATNYYFAYGPVGADAQVETQDEYAGSGIDLKLVSTTVTGLAPDTEYEFRLTAKNDAGKTEGPLMVFRTPPVAAEAAKDEPLPPVMVVEPAKAEPEFAKTVVVDPGGMVKVKAPGGDWATLPAGAKLPVGAAVDARQGHVELTSEGCHGDTQTGTFGGGVFSVRQPRSGCGRVDLYLRGGNFRQCRTLGAQRRARGGQVAGASRVRRVRRLWGRDSGGSFRSHGRHSHATVRGTRWVTVDRCGATVTRVTEGAVAVRDYARRRTVLVRAGRTYVAKSRRVLRREARQARHHSRR
jgi:streptogramin lyase